MIPRYMRCTPAHTSCSMHHSRLVDEYHAERYRQEMEREAVTGDYPEENREYNRTHDMIDFKKWLVGSTGMRFG